MVHAYHMAEMAGILLVDQLLDIQHQHAEGRYLNSLVGGLKQSVVLGLLILEMLDNLAILENLELVGQVIHLIQEVVEGVTMEEVVGRIQVAVEVPVIVGLVAAV